MILMKEEKPEIKPVQGKHLYRGVAFGTVLAAMTGSLPVYAGGIIFGHLASSFYEVYSDRRKRSHGRGFGR